MVYVLNRMDNLISVLHLKSLSMKENALVMLVPFRQCFHPLGMKSACEKSLCGPRTTFTDMKYIWVSGFSFSVFYQPLKYLSFHSNFYSISQENDEGALHLILDHIQDPKCS